MTSADLDTPGGRIKFLRRAKDMTQQTLARKVFVSQPAVAQWESDKCLPTRPAQSLVADALGTTRSFLFGEDA